MDTTICGALLRFAPLARSVATVELIPAAKGGVDSSVFASLESVHSLLSSLLLGTRAKAATIGEALMRFFVRVRIELGGINSHVWQRTAPA
jgi:hypothetical protein